jgi:hypothetical protein
VRARYDAFRERLDDAYRFFRERNWPEVAALKALAVCAGFKHVALAVMVLALAGCGPKCIRGHDVTVHPDAYSWVELLHLGDTIIPVVHEEPARDVQRFVCDEYEAEK